MSSKPKVTHKRERGKKFLSYLHGSILSRTNDSSSDIPMDPNEVEVDHAKHIFVLDNPLCNQVTTQMNDLKGDNVTSLLKIRFMYGSKYRTRSSSECRIQFQSLRRDWSFIRYSELDLILNLDPSRNLIFSK